LLTNAQPRGDRERNVRRVGHRRKLDKPHAVGIRVGKIGRHAQGETRLARATRAGQRQQTGRFEQPAYRGELVLSPKEARQFGGQVVARRGDGQRQSAALMTTVLICVYSNSVSALMVRPKPLFL
jgi:hypothetical protein